MPAERPNPKIERSIKGVESVASHEKPLRGGVYLCIGASRPDKSIGGPTAIALAQAGADVFITGGDPKKERRATSVLDAVLEMGGANSARGTFDVTTEDGRKALIDEVKTLYGEVDGVLYYPAGGLVGDDVEKRLAHGTALNVTAPIELAKSFLQEGLIKRGGFFQMTPSIYSWGHPHTTAPDRRYDTVAQTKHEGEKEMHALVPDFENAGVSLVYIVGNVVDGTFAMNFMQRGMNDDDKETVLVSANVEGQRKLPTTANMAQAAVSVATRARQGSLPLVHVEYVGIAESAQIPLETKLRS